MMGNHIDFLKTLSDSNLNNINEKVRKHIETSNRTNNAIDAEEPDKLKILIEYLALESRGFGWSFPENELEKLCESSFWTMLDKIKNLIGGMTLNERLYYFGYSEEFEKIPVKHKSDRDRILHKLFVGESSDNALNRR